MSASPANPAASGAPLKVRSVTGESPASELGLTLMHEHVLVGFPGWQFDAKAPRFVRAEVMSRAVDRMQRLKDLGVRTFVDPCPMDLGRDVEFLAELSQKSGMRIVCATGMYFEAEGITHTVKHLSKEQIAEIYISELTEGVGGSGIRAGLIKVATGPGKVTPYEQKLLDAAAAASKETGAPILSHTQGASCGHEQIDAVEKAGLPAHRILVGHSDGRDDPDYHESLAARGAYVGFDRFGLEMLVPDAVRIKNVKKLIDAGHASRVMLSHDSILCWLGRPVPYAQRFEDLLKFVPDWHPTKMFDKVLPALREQGVPQQTLDSILTDNPRRFFELRD